MVIFGAGASFDSCPTYPAGIQLGPEIDACRLPLAKDLFDNREIFRKTLDKFPQCKTVVPRLRDPAVLKGTVSIEKRLEEIREEAREYPRAAKELVAVRFYLQRALSNCEVEWGAVTRGITNQLTLLREIERTNTSHEPVCLVTFNYDRILEIALESLGTEHKIGKMQDYTAEDRPFRLFKLHGSVNWGLEFDGGPNFWPNPPSSGGFDRLIIDKTPPIHHPEIYVFSDAQTMLSKDRSPLFPAIAIPVEEKNEFQCPKPALEALKRLMPDVTRVITIGWRASEAHFLRLMDAHLKPNVPIFVVAGTPKEAEALRPGIIRAMSSAPRSCRAENANGFTNFMLSGLATKILSA